MNPLPSLSSCPPHQDFLAEHRQRERGAIAASTEAPEQHEAQMSVFRAT